MPDQIGVAVIGLDHWYSAFSVLDQNNTEQLIVVQEVERTYRQHTTTKEIIACINPENLRSIRIASKLGFLLGGRKKAYGTEFDCYRLRMD